MLIMAKNTHNTITATELVRNLSVVIDQVRMTGNSLYITKGSQTVAKISPPPKPGLAMNELSNLLRSLPTLGEDAKGMEADLINLRRQADLPNNPWD